MSEGGLMEVEFVKDQVGICYCIYNSNTLERGQRRSAPILFVNGSTNLLDSRFEKKLFLQNTISDYGGV
jgi:hypothetical protein